jgi:predicted nucleic acid-binding protein
MGPSVSLKFLLDTNILIGLDKGTPVAQALIARNNARPELCAVSQITRIELLSFQGLQPTELARIATLLAAVTVLLIDEQIEAETIALRRQHRLKLPDAIIAATARTRGLTLLTLDDRLSATLSTD